MKKKWETPMTKIVPMDMEKFSDVKNLSDAELKMKLEQAGYEFKKTYRASEGYILEKMAGSDILIPMGYDVPNFTGYVEIAENMVVLWEKLQRPCRLKELEEVLEEVYEMSHEAAVQEVLDFINLLKEHNMVVIQ